VKISVALCTTLSVCFLFSIAAPTYQQNLFSEVFHEKLSNARLNTKQITRLQHQQTDETLRLKGFRFPKNITNRAVQ